MPSPALTIVLPAYNEEARLGPALDELFTYLHGPARNDGRLPSRVDVLVVDDGSTDGTAAIVQARPEFMAGAAHPADGGAADGAAAANAAVHGALAGNAAVHGANEAAPDASADRVPRSPSLGLLTVPHAGKGAAVRAGMLAAQGDLVVFADADMATPPDQLPLLAAALETADVALGSRVQPDGSDMRASQPRLRRFLGRAFRAAARVWVTGPVAADTQCGFKGFRRAAARDLFGRQRVTSIVFDVELIFLARRRGYRIVVVPIVWTDRRGSRMHARPRLALRVAWDLLRVPLVHRGLGKAAGEQSAERASSRE